MGEILRVYPTRLKAEEEIAKHLAASRTGAAFGGSIISFGQFERLLTAELVGAEPVSDVRRWLLLHEAASYSPHRPPAGDTEGFVRSTGEVIHQIKLGLVTADELEHIEGFAPGKEEWLKKVFARYERLLRKNGARDGADIMAELLARMAALAAPPRCVSRFGEIHIHGVFHFAPSRFELIRLLGQRLPVILQFPLPDDRRRVFDFAERDIRKFQSLEDDAGNIELRFDEPSSAPTPLAGFCASLFGEKRPAPIVGLSDAVEILKNTGRYREIEEVAEKILLMKEGREWSDFCLVFRDLEKYGQIVEDVFRRAGIPVYLRRGVPVRANPYVRTLLGIFGAIETGYDRDEIAKLATSSYFAFLPAGVADHEAENLLFAAGVTNGPPAYWKKRLSSAHRGKKGKTVVAKILKLVATLEKLEKATRAGACIAAFKAVVKLLASRPLAASAPFSLRDAWCRSAFDEAWSELETSVGELGMANAHFGWQAMRRLLLNSLGNAHTPEWPGRNHVFALNVHELAGRTFKTVFICGLHDGEFPLRLQRGSILGEAEKSAFNKNHAEALLARTPRLAPGRMVFSRLGESWEEEAFIFYLAARAAETKLVLTHSATDLAGRELLPSPFLEEIMDAWPEIKPQVTKPVALEKEYASQLDASAREAKLLADLFSRGADEAGALRSWYRHFAQKPGFLMACERSNIERERLKFYAEFDPAIRARAANRFTGKLDGPSSAPFMGYLRNKVRRTHSPTALERYAECPFRYFMSRVLECEPAPIPTAETERTEEGNAAHHILQNYYHGFKTTRPLPPLAKRLAALGKCADEVFHRMEKEGVAVEPELWEISKQQILTALERLVADEETFYGDEPFEVLATEYAFGGKDRPSTLACGGETVRLTGKIDRVDWLPQSRLLRVIDYKYSSGKAVYAALLKPETFCETSFQAPLYLFAALKHLGRNAAGGYAAYCLLKKEPAITKHIPAMFDALPPPALAALEGDERFGGKIIALVKKMESGDFSVTPGGCVFCPYPRVCRIIEVREVQADE
ncbi:MAG: PD-(D/E)XK nuclease family protein [Nitrospinae bacterium]|nr:PD-(D/E)XK nuclease family protein [Nitrospinota bacterium]